MHIDIWSDIACPFCYIGKRHLELALDELAFASQIEVKYHAYLLNKDYHNPDDEDIFTYLTREKHLAKEQVVQMTQHVKSYAEAVGLMINFEKNIPANTFQAHRLIYLAASVNKQADMKERLFKVHFEEGLNLQKTNVLEELAKSIGISPALLDGFFEDGRFEAELNQDLYQAQLMGISGVPFFLLNQKYAISGAQPVGVLKQAVTSAYQEWLAEKG